MAPTVAKGGKEGKKAKKSKLVADPTPATEVGIVSLSETSLSSSSPLASP